VSYKLKFLNIVVPYTMSVAWIMECSRYGASWFG